MHKNLQKRIGIVSKTVPRCSNLGEKMSSPNEDSNLGCLTYCASTLLVVLPGLPDTRTITLFLLAYLVGLIYSFKSNNGLTVKIGDPVGNHFVKVFVGSVCM